MPKPKSNPKEKKDEKDKNSSENEEGNNEVKIKEEDSSLAEFTKRSLPSDKEVEKFDQYIEKAAYEYPLDEVVEDADGEEINESLNEIYQDENGDMVDVKKLDVRKKHGILFWFFTFIFFIGGLFGAGYAAYYYLYEQPGSDVTAVKFSIEGKNEVLAGEEFFYTIKYENLSNINLNKARIEVNYPENFVFLDSDKETVGEKNNLWEIDKILAKNSSEIKIKGMLIGLKGDTEIALANLTYTPDNFSSEFKKEATLATTIKDIGIDFDFDYINSALIGEEHEILLRFSEMENNYINNFRLIFEPQENIEIINVSPEDNDVEEDKKANYTFIRPGVWQIDEITDEEKIMPIKFKFTEKVTDKQEITLFFEKVGEDNSSTSTENDVIYYKFFEQRIEFEVMKSDLNLTLIINGSRDDQGVDPEQTLNYSISYKNKGETDMKDVVIMAVLESDYLDWTALKDESGGKERGNTITWTKTEIPGLGLLKKNDEGVIDFAIKVAKIGDVNGKKDYQIKSFSQFSIGDSEKISENEDNRSNTIISKINSDLKLSEKVKYFSDDEIPVGTGPHPPKVDERTSYKVYWNITNNLHELDDLKVVTKLPDYVSWDSKDRATAGGVSYDENTREVTWNVGRLPITVFEANAEFSVSITPSEEDKNKIMLLLSGTSVTAIDNETGSNLNFSSKAKTTKLEDDLIAPGDGVVGG